MQAAFRSRYGSIDVVELREVERPAPAEGEILVRVRAASVNRADLDALGPRPAFARLFMGLRAPRVHRLGIDVAGVVEAVGPGATRYQPGDAVFADLFAHGSGAFGEYVSAREDAFEPMPADLSFEQAATLPHSAVLAVQGLRTRRGRTIRPGERMLVAGASGNVGPFAVQIAKARGAHVTGVCRYAKVEFVRSLGADEVIDYQQVDYTRSRGAYDWIIDTDSHHSILAARRALKPNGVYISLGGNSLQILEGMLLGPLVSLFSDRWSGIMLWWKPFAREDVADLVRLIGDGQVTPIIDRSFPLRQIREALHWVDDGHARGKVVVIP